MWGGYVCLQSLIIFGDKLNMMWKREENSESGVCTNIRSINAISCEISITLLMWYFISWVIIW